jgi:hypothetical protein
VEDEWSAAGGYRAGQQLLNSRVHFTAVVAANDQIALGLVEAFSEKGLQVPEDISVVGFDNMPESRFFRPPLTTVHHDFDLLGATSVQYVTEAISNPKMPRRHHKIAPELAIRESVSRISTKPIRRKLGATTRRLANQSRQPAHNRGGESACSKLLKNEASSATLSSVERRRR